MVCSTVSSGSCFDWEVRGSLHPTRGEELCRRREQVFRAGYRSSKRMRAWLSLTVLTMGGSHFTDDVLRARAVQQLAQE